MIVAMAGLPGSGKSFFAKRLASLKKAILLDKDTFRSNLFPEELIDFTDEQNDLCVEIMLKVAEYILRKNDRAVIIIDGRTFTKKARVDHLIKLVNAIGTELKFIECVCSDETARKRIAGDGIGHLAKNRNFDLYLKLKQDSDELRESKLILDTDTISIEDRLQKAVEYLDI
jgi:adenylylsulfate kinase